MNCIAAFSLQLKSFSRKDFRALALTALLASSGCMIPVSDARAAPEGNPKSVSFSLAAGGGFNGPIRVITDGLLLEDQDYSDLRWTRFKPNTSISFEGDVQIDMKGLAKIRAFGIYFGECDGHACFEKPGTPLMYSDFVYVGTINKHVIFDRPVSDILPVTNPQGIAPSVWGAQIIAQCNAALDQGVSIHDGHSFNAVVPVTLGFDTYIGNTLPAAIVDIPAPLKDVDHEKTIFVSIPVVCEAVPVPSKVQPPFDLLAATLHGDPVQYSGACPVGIKLFMSAKSNVQGPFEARIESKTGWVSEKYTYQTTESNADGTWSKHFQDTLTVPVDLPVNQSSGGGAQVFGKGIGNVQMNPKNEEPQFPGQGVPKGPKQVQTGFNPDNFHEDSLRLVVTGSGKTIKTDWWKYSVTCDPKKAQVAQDAPSGVKQTVFVQQAFLALLPAAPKDGSKCGITVSGLIQTNVKNVNVTFRLKNHHGNTTNAQTIQTSHANNIGKFVEYLDFSTSGQGVWVTPGGGWALPGGGAGSQAGQKTGSLQIVVENPSAFEGNVANYDFTCYDPIPTGLQQPPTAKVDPAIPAIPGAVVGKGNNASAQPEKLAPQIVCLGGTVRGGKCECGGETVVIGGITSGGRTTFHCQPKRQEAAKPAVADPRPVKPAPRIVCAGGSVRNDACICQPGYAPVKTGATSYRCNRVAVLPPPVVTPKPVVPQRVIAPQIACAGGVVRSNRCFCPSGKSLQNGVCRTIAPVRGATPQRVR